MTSLSEMPFQYNNGRKPFIKTINLQLTWFLWHLPGLSMDPERISVLLLTVLSALQPTKEEIWILCSVLVILSTKRDDFYAHAQMSALLVSSSGTVCVNQDLNRN